MFHAKAIVRRGKLSKKKYFIQNIYIFPESPAVAPVTPVIHRSTAVEPKRKTMFKKKDIDIEVDQNIVKGIKDGLENVPLQNRKKPSTFFKKCLDVYYGEGLWESLRLPRYGVWKERMEGHNYSGLRMEERVVNAILYLAHRNFESIESLRCARKKMRQFLANAQRNQQHNGSSIMDDLPFMMSNVDNETVFSENGDIIS